MQLRKTRSGGGFAANLLCLAASSDVATIDVATICRGSFAPIHSSGQFCCSWQRATDACHRGSIVLAQWREPPELNLLFHPGAVECPDEVHNYEL